MKGLLGDALSFVKKLWFTLPLLLTAALGYGGSLFSNAVGIDALCADRYLGQGWFIQQGRPGWALTFLLLDAAPPKPFFSRFLGLLLLLTAAVCLCVLLRRASGQRLHRAVYPVFACLLVSYPLMNETWYYENNCVIVGLCFLLTALALLCLERCWTDGGMRDAAAAGLYMTFVLATYESFSVVFLCGGFAVLLLYGLYGGRSETERPARVMWVRFLKMTAILAAALVLKVLLSKLVLLLSGYSGVQYTGNQSGYFSDPRGFVEVARAMLEGLAIYLGLLGVWYFPVAVLQGAALAAAIAGVVLSARRKLPLWLPVLGMLLTLVALPVAAGAFTGYRTYQVAALFVAFVGALLAQLTLEGGRRPWVRAGVIGLLFFLCFRQATNLNHWMQLDEARYREEAETVRGIAYRLESEADLTKPVVFIGKYELSTELLEQCSVTAADPLYAWVLDKTGSTMQRFKYVGTNVESVLNWGLSAFGDVNGEIVKLFHHLGFPDVQKCTEEMYIEANGLGKAMGVWPARDSVLVTDAYTVVKLGPLPDISWLME